MFVGRPKAHAFGRPFAFRAGQVPSGGGALVGRSGAGLAVVAGGS
jgi:hypothetical protein